MSDLDRLREVGLLVRRPAYEELLVTRRRRTRQARAVTAATAAVAAAVVVTALATTGGTSRTDLPPIDPTPTPARTEHVDDPSGQRMITPDIGPADIRGWTVLATLTNVQPQHRGEAELTTTVNVHTEMTNYSIYCHAADPSVWLFFDYGDGGGGYGPCDEGSAKLPPPDLPDQTYARDSGTQTPWRMWVTRLSPEVEACYRKSEEDCEALYGTPLPELAAGTEFGFRVFDLRPAPFVLELFEDVGNGETWRFEALTSLQGVPWLLDRAVVAAPDAHRLAFTLPSSDPEHLVDVYVAHGPHRDRCMTQHADEIPDFVTTDHGVYEAAIERVCGVELRLVVDGTAIAPEVVDPGRTGHFRELGARLLPGADHVVEVEVTRGDPRNIRYAVVVRTRTQMP